RLHPEIPLLALLRLVHLRITLLLAVLGRGGRMDNGRVHDRAGRDPHSPALKCRFTVSSISPPSPCSSSRWRNLHTVVSSGTGSRPRSIPTESRITTESYSASSTAGSDRLNHCCKK